MLPYCRLEGTGFPCLNTIDMKYVTELTTSVTRQNTLPSLRYAVMPAVVFYAVSLLILHRSGFSVVEVLRDPAQMSGKSSFLGFISIMGVWLWVASATVCFFCSFHSRSKGRGKEFLLLVGLFSTLLAVDDYFLIHDRYVHEKICYLTYAGIAGTILIRHFERILEPEGFPFVIAGFLLALSIATDSTQFRNPLPYTAVQVLEEGFKFMGISVWLFLCSKSGLQELKRSWRDSASELSSSPNTPDQTPAS